MADAATETKTRTGAVQSIGRAFALLELMADAGGTLGLSQLANQSGLPLPTIHRLLRTLVDLGYLRQEPSRQYVLGPRLIRLGDASSRMLSVWARPHLARLVDELGESANLAMLDGDEIVYVAQAPSRHSMRMFTEVGRRVQPHCTAVGKAIMATHADRRGARDPQAFRHARDTPTPPSPTPTSSPRSSPGPPSTATRSTRASRRPAYGASPSRYPTRSPDSPSQSPAPPAA